MKLKLSLLLLLAASHFIFSQEKVTESGEKEVVAVNPTQADGNGKIENGVYTCYKFNWKITIPSKYEVIGANGGNTNPHLIGFGLGPRNTFNASFESLAGSTIKSFEDHKNFMIKLLNDTYSNIPTLKFELDSSDMKIGKYDFYKIETRLYDPKTNELLLTQDLYNCFIDNNLFSVNINYNNPAIGKLMTDTFISSLSQ